eukprot:3013048-Rhodomonas_salina.3
MSIDFCGQFPLTKHCNDKAKSCDIRSVTLVTDWYSGFQPGHRDRSCHSEHYCCSPYGEVSLVSSRRRIVH